MEVNIEHVTLVGLKNSICEMYQPPALENVEVLEEAEKPVESSQVERGNKESKVIEQFSN